MSLKLRIVNYKKLINQKQIRSVWNEEEKQWYLSIVDGVEVLTDSPTPWQYWGKLKIREFDSQQLYPKWVQLKLESKDGKKYATDCANVKGLLRIIQAIRIEEERDYAILTAEISKATFGLTPSEYKKLKGGKEKIGIFGII